MEPSIVVLMPSYGQNEQYSESALETYFETVPNAKGLLIDDHGPAWDQTWADRMIARYGEDRLVIEHLANNAQLTPVLNYGFNKIFYTWPDTEYIAAVNNDILFTHQWYQPMVAAIKAGFSLCGPMSNAPGVTAHGKQEISRHLKGYQLSDDRQVLNNQAEQLRQQYSGRQVTSEVNGFFLFSSLEQWRTGSYGPDKVFQCPITHAPSGRINRTPLMTGQEDELQHRWRKVLKRRFCICTDSFIFHYRSVSRGKKFRMGLWARKK